MVRVPYKGVEMEKIRDASGYTRNDMRRGLLLLILLAVANLVIWGIAFLVLGKHSPLWAAALLAWTFGFRHAMDADHIVAIDLVARRLMAMKRSPLGVGFFFSLGHSSIMMFGILALVLFPSQTWIRQWSLLGGHMSCLISVVFLLFLAVLNIRVAFHQWYVLQHRSLEIEKETPHAHGFLAVVARPLFALISRSWHMFAVGILFGLGFDILPEIGLLGLAALHNIDSLGLIRILIIPMLFMASMTFTDSLDTILMIRAYGWSGHSYRRRVLYNFCVTCFAVIASIGVGVVEYAQELADTGWFHGAIASWATLIGDHFMSVGIGICSIFLGLWVIEALLDRIRN